MKKKYVDILLIAVAVLLNACSSDDSGAQTAPYTPDKTTTMGIYMLLEADWGAPEEKRITYNTGTGKWNASFEVEAGKTYSVYGYMPKVGGVNSSLTAVTSDGATLSIMSRRPTKD